MKDYCFGSKRGTHKVKVTFQLEEYKGYIIQEIGGNCSGLDLLEFDSECMCPDDIERLYENECNLHLIDDESFSINLKDEEGREQSTELYDSELQSIVVGIEIIEFKEDN